VEDRTANARIIVVVVIAQRGKFVPLFEKLFSIQNTSFYERMIDAAARNASWSSSSSSPLFFLSKRCRRRKVSSSSSSSSPLSPQPGGGVVKVECKNRILFTPDEFFENEKRRARLRASDARLDHLRTVLKKTREGETVKMTILNEGLAVGRIVTTGNDEDEDGVLIEVVVLEEEKKKKKKNVKVSLLLAMPRPKVLRRLLSVFAQFGVENVHLFKAEKTERFYFQSDVLAQEMLVREFTRGVEQNAVDSSFPNASKCRGLKQVLEELVLENENSDDLAERVRLKKGADFEWLLRVSPPREKEKEGRRKKIVPLLAHPSSESVSLTDALHQSRKKNTNSNSSGDEDIEILLAIGPEGGWSQNEVETFQSFKFVNVGLGSRIFTTDVATISLLSSINEYIEYRNR
jgi:16S rRNA U1498 N3-methylase RsmE